MAELGFCVANGSVDSLVGSDGDMVYTFDVTPNAIGEVTVDIPAAAGLGVSSLEAETGST
jgi:hypothetical protein